MAKKKPAGKETPGEATRRPDSRKKTAADIKRDVKFVLHALEAKEVYLSGEFNNWDTTSVPMKKSSAGEWQAEVDLAPGRYEYNFFVDGVWVEDPGCRERIANPFGTRNCVIQVN